MSDETNINNECIDMTEVKSAIMKGLQNHPDLDSWTKNITYPNLL